MVRPFVLSSANTLFAEHGLEPDAETVHTLETIHVASERLSEYVKNHPQNIVELDQEEIRERNFLEVGEALDSMPGVDVTHGSSGMGARVSIRGSSGAGSVLVLIDGRPINSGRDGGGKLGSVPIEEV